MSVIRLSTIFGRTAPPYEAPITLTGCQTNDILHGSKDAEGVVLMLCSGNFPSPVCVRDSALKQLGREETLRLVRDSYNCGSTQATHQFEQIQWGESLPNHCPVGSNCCHDFGKCDSQCTPGKFMVINPGKWQDFADHYNNGHILEDIVLNHRHVDWRDIIKLFVAPGEPGGKMLACRQSLFTLSRGKRILDPETDSDVLKSLEVVEVSPFSQASICWKVSDYMAVQCEPSSDHPLTMDNVKKIFTDMFPSGGDNMRAVIPLLDKLSQGILRSALQKTIRFGAYYVDFSSISGEYPSRFPSPMFAALVAGYMFVSRGGYVPNPSGGRTFVAGSTSVLKRLAVILVEDVWLSSESKIQSLLGMALLSKEIHSYQFSETWLKEVMKIARDSVNGDSILCWRQNSPMGTKRVHVDSEQLKFCSRIFKTIGGMSGDTSMFDTVASKDMWGKSYRKYIPAVMPIEHVVDQHAFREIAIMLPVAAPVKEKFKLIFGGCSGVNPRLGQKLSGDLVKIRTCQRNCMVFPFSIARRTEESIGSTTLRAPISPGSLAAAVGPITTMVGRKSVWGILGKDYPEEIIVITKPCVRNAKDLFWGVSAENKEDVIAYIKEKRIKVSTTKFSGTLHFRDNQWCIDDVPWGTICANGAEVEVPLLPPAAWSPSAATIMDDSVAYECLTLRGEGIRENAKEMVVELVSNLNYENALRLKNILKFKDGSIGFPVPSLDGKPGQGELLSFDEDWLLYRTLLLISGLVPHALEPRRPPNFIIKNSIVMENVVTWVEEGSLQSKGQILPLNLLALAPQLSTSWSSHPQWMSFRERCEPMLKIHQQYAIGKMLEEDNLHNPSGHFIVLETGLGKTLISLLYSYLWNREHEEVKRVFWVAPKETINCLQDQLTNKWKVPTFVVPRITTKAKPAPSDVTTLVFRDYHVNIISTEHIQNLAENGLDKHVPYSFVVFDEVDMLYERTIRTSYALKMAKTCNKLAAQTATPFGKHDHYLRQWLENTTTFPIGKNGLWVAACHIISAQCDLKIQVEDSLELIPLCAKVKQECMQHYIGGNWRALSNLIRGKVDHPMLKLAMEEALEDRNKNPSGGVLLVAEDAGHADYLIKEGNQNFPKVKFGGFSELMVKDTDSYGVIVVPLSKNRGYNSAVRLGTLITQVYGSNPSSRHQMRGRIKRLEQKRSCVKMITVTMENSVLHFLHRKHQNVDTMNLSLTEAAKKFSSEVLSEML